MFWVSFQTHGVRDLWGNAHHKSTCRKTGYTNITYIGGWGQMEWIGGAWNALGPIGTHWGHLEWIGGNWNGLGCIWNGLGSNCNARERTGMDGNQLITDLARTTVWNRPERTPPSQSLRDK